MILTYKIKHNRNFEKELEAGKKVAEYSLSSKSITSKDVKHLGLKSMISNQILRKYSRNKTLKNIKSVKLAVPNQGIKLVQGKVYIPCLKLTLPVYFDKGFKKINQVEVGKEYAYVSVSYNEPKVYKPKCLIGVDRNTTKHVLVGANLKTGKILKLGKECEHIHNKYKNIRRELQAKGKYRKVKSIKQRESNLIKNINHQITSKLINEAVKVKGGLVLENLKGIRQTAKSGRKQRYSLNSWSYAQQEEMLKYKAKKFGVPIFYVEPQYTSQECSCCGHIEKANRKLKLFQCLKCGKVENADVNASFNIAQKHKLMLKHQQIISRLNKERDLFKGSTDTPKEALLAEPSNFRTQSL
jgi:putative transposase